MQRSTCASQTVRTVVLVCLLMGMIVPALAAPTVWVAPSLVRVRPTDTAGTATQITLYAAKGETESFQIIVQAPTTGALTNVNVTAPSLGGPTSTLYREHYLYLAKGSADWATNVNKPQGAGYWPDGLVPFLNPTTGAALTGGIIGSAPFTVAAGKNQPVWVDVYVPRTTAAGTYTGTYTVTSAQGNATVSLTLKVWHFSLPLQPALHSCFLYWETKDNGAGRGVLQADQELLKNRLNPISTTPSYERSLIDNYGLGSSALSFWSNAYHTTSMPTPPTLAQILADKAKHQSDLYLYCYSADEVSDPAIYSGLKSWARVLHSAGVDQFVTTPPVPDLYDDGSGTGRSAVDDWVLLPKTYDAYRSNVLTVQAKGDKVWSYNATQQDDYSPKWLLDYAPVNFRLQPGFISASLGLVGIFYWRVDWWSTDSWNGTQPWASYPGEGQLVYPGAAVGLSGLVMPSLRLKYLRDGVDDYDYVQLLKAQGQGAWAVSVAKAVGPDWTNWTRDTTALEAARLQLANKLESLATGGSVTVTATASPTTIASGGTVTLTASATCSTGAAITTWSWSDGGAGGTFSSSTAKSPTYTAPANTTGSSRTLALMVTATAGTLSGSQSVSVVEQSTATSSHSLTLNAYAAPSTVASKGSTSLTVTATDSLGHTGLTYAWTDNGAGGTFSSTTVANPTYTAPGNGSSSSVTRTLTVTVTCVWLSPSISNRANVTVTEGAGSSGHSVTVTASAGATTLASGGSTTLSATATDSASHTGLAYAWSDNGAGGTFSSTTVANPTYTAPGNSTAAAATRTLTVTVTCKWTSPWVSSTASVTVAESTGAHAVTVTASASPTTIASGASTTLTAAATCNRGHTGIAYAWSDNGAGGTFSSATSASTTYTPPANTSGATVTRKLTVTATCKWTSPWVSASANVSVLEKTK
jgi:hypothetical protein